MLTGVKFEGLALNTVEVEGPDGPRPVSPEPTRRLAVFALEGWDPNFSPEGAEDERQGHEVVRLMEDVGDAHADGKWTAEEALEVVLRIEPRYGGIIRLILPVAEEAFRRVADDGRLDRKDALALAWKVATSVAGQVLPG